MTTKLTRQQYAEAVFAQLRGVGPQTVGQIQSDLQMTKRQVEDALYLLVSRAKVEHGYPTRSPLVYQVVRELAEEKPGA